jgi:hypothetical protein
VDNNFGGVIWTNHALFRLRERGISQGDAWATWKKPDRSSFAKQKGAWVYHRTFGNQKIEVVAKQNDKKEWIVLSVWSKTILNLKPQRGKTLGSVLKKIFGKFV